MCYYVKFGRSASNSVRINRRESSKLGSAAGPSILAVGVWLTPRNTPVPHTCYPAEFGRRSNGTSVIKEIHLRKKFDLVSRLSRSVKVIGTDIYRSATYDFLINVPYQSLAYFVPFQR